MVALWELAVSLVHELKHAAMYAAWGGGYEMPFKCSTAAETGLEWEHFVFGGTIWKNETYLDPAKQHLVRPWPAASIVRSYLKMIPTYVSLVRCRILSPAGMYGQASLKTSSRPCSGRRPFQKMEPQL